MSVIDTLITNRNEGYYNVSDLNRVESAVTYLTNLLHSYGYAVNTTPLVIPAKTVAVTNLIADGSFETGVGDYTSRTVSTDIAHRGSHSLKSYHLGTWDAYYPVRTAIPGHKYYLSQWLYVTEKTGPIWLVAGWVINGSDVWWNASQQDNNSYNVWQKLSCISEACPDNCTQIRAAFGDPQTANSAFYTDDCMIVDLTAAFGAGNEPTKAWCDANIPYFDGTTNIVAVPEHYEWWRSDIPVASQMTTYLNNVHALKTSFYGATDLPPKTVTATNIITNGNFASGTVGWTNTTSTFFAQNNTLTFTATAQYGMANQLCSSLVKGHVYYVRAFVKATSSAVSLLMADYITTAEYGEFHSGSGNYELLSHVYTLPSNATIPNYFFGVRDNGAANWANVNIQEYAVIDLTAAFGAGSEPTKAWCGENISYFDGTKTLIQAMDKLTAEQANNIEKLLAEIDILINRMTVGFRKCGTFKSGQGVILP